MSITTRARRGPSIITISDLESSDSDEVHGSQVTDDVTISDESTSQTTNGALIPEPVTDEQEEVSCDLFAAVERFSPWLPDYDPECKEALRTAAKWRQRPRLLLLVFLTAMSIFFANSVALCVLFFARKAPYSNGFISIFEGSCNTSRQLSIGFHILINLLSSGLLAASNLCTQLSTAPTRAQVDEVHQKDDDYYDIGILSFRNWRKATRTKKAICAFLILSSLPLHFIYNSVISTTNPQFAYPALVVTSSFLGGAPVKHANYDVNKVYNATLVESMQRHATDPARYRRVEKSECVATYSDPFHPRSNLLIVTEDSQGSTNSSLLEYMYFESGSGNWSIWDQQVWICSEGYDNNGILLVDPENPNCSNKDFSAKRIDHWQKWKHPIQYCLMLTQTDEMCALNFSPILLFIVCVCNLIKCACIFYCFMESRKISSRHDFLLCTVGDAIASFLESPDPMQTTSMPNPQLLLAQVERLKTLRKTAPWLKAPVKPRREAARWYETVSRRCLLLTFSMCTAAVLLATIQLITSIRSIMAQQVRTTISQVFAIGYGEIDPSALLVIPGAKREGVRGFVASTMYANYWQVLVSILYFSANSLLTRFHVSHEWSRYANQRKQLRVSQPKGMQRSTYFISLPYKYGAPLLVGSAILHLLVSQSIFLVNGKIYVYTSGDSNAELGVDNKNSFVTAGINCWGILASILFGVTMVVGLLITSYVKRLDSLVPIVSSDSRSIQAHCQAPSGDTQAYLFPVLLAAIPNSNGIGTSHCAFTTRRNAIPAAFHVHGSSEHMSEPNLSTRAQIVVSGWIENSTNVWKSGIGRKIKIKRSHKHH